MLYRLASLVSRKALHRSLLLPYWNITTNVRVKGQQHVSCISCD